MRTFLKIYDGIVDGFAFLAGLVYFFLFAIVVYDVVTRTAGVLVVTWVVAVSEYALLYSTALAAPWLLREKGHACIEFVRAMVPSAVRDAMEKLVHLVGCALSIVVVWYSIPVMIASWDEYDIRAFEMPRWLLYLPVSVGFALMAIGFARYLFGSDTLYAQVKAGDEGF